MNAITRIQQRREAIRQELHTLLEANPDTLPDDARARCDALEAELPALVDQERRARTLDELDRQAGGRPLDPATPERAEVRIGELRARVPEGFDGAIWRTQDGLRVPVLEARHSLASFVTAPESRATELGIGGFLRALRYGPRDDLERRVLGEASVGTGGAFLPTPLSLEVIDLLRAKSVAFAAGARAVPMSTLTLRFARQTADAVGAWRAENDPITIDDPAFDAVTLTAKSWALLVKCSRELLEDAQNLDAQLRNAFAAGTALALDRAVLNGAGSAIEPKGIATTAGIQVVDMGATAGAALTGWTPFLDAVAMLEAANAGTVSAAIMAPRTARVIYGLQDTLHQPLNPPSRVANIPLLVTTSMGTTEAHGTSNVASSIILGDFSQVLVGMRTDLQVSVLTERFADSGQVAFVCWLRGDVAVARPAALARISGITPT